MKEIEGGDAPSSIAAGGRGLVAAIVQTVKDAREYITDAGDIAYKAFADGDVAKEIPVVKWAAKAYDIRESYQIRRLTRNTVAFIDAVASGKRYDAEKLRNHILSDQRFEAEFQDIVSDILIEGSRPKKAMILAGLVNALCDEQVTKEEFERLSHIIDSASMAALNAFEAFALKNKIPMNASGRYPEEGLLFSMGLATRFGTHLRVAGDAELLWKFGFQQG